MNGPHALMMKTSLAIGVFVIISAVGYFLGGFMATSTDLPVTESGSTTTVVERPTTPAIVSDLAPNDFTEEIPPEAVRNPDRLFSPDTN